MENSFCCPNYFLLKAIFIIFIFQLHINLNGQNYRDLELKAVRNALLDKSKTQENIACITMGLGAVTFPIGISRSSSGGEAIALIGLGFIVTSITFFVKSNKNQNKALKMYIGLMEKSPLNSRVSYRSHEFKVVSTMDILSMPVIGVKIPL
ncbi:hypothetical protein [Membranihabitans marinus]|uniref:hypothetical protein n=1 Tax=Membranihabitans marinus TaxID=1227546 RepID=UPI001F167E96|nr:hypothetical protein [Membranihabitans marinus]